MVKRLSFLAASIFLVITLLVMSCASPSIENVEEKVEAAFSALNEGNLIEARKTFEEILNKDPKNPEANAGIALVILYETYTSYDKDLFTLAFSVSNLLQQSQLPLLSFESATVKSPLVSFSGVRNFVEAVKSLPYEDTLTVLKDIWTSLNLVENHLKNAVEADVEFNLYLNRFD